MFYERNPQWLHPARSMGRRVGAARGPRSVFSRFTRSRGPVMEQWEVRERLVMEHLEARERPEGGDPGICRPIVREGQPLQTHLEACSGWMPVRGHSQIVTHR